MMSVRMTRRAMVRGAGRLSVGAWAAGTTLRGWRPRPAAAQTPVRIEFWHAMEGNLGQTVVRPA